VSHGSHGYLHIRIILHTESTGWEASLFERIMRVSLGEYEWVWVGVSECACVHKVWEQKVGFRAIFVLSWKAIDDFWYVGVISGAKTNTNQDLKQYLEFMNHAILGHRKLHLPLLMLSSITPLCLRR
jgi:hypothetical protein